MSNIVQFPTQSDRSWSNTEELLRKLFDSGGVPESVQQRVLGRVHDDLFVDPPTLSFQAIDPDQLAEPLRSVHIEMIKQIRVQCSAMLTRILIDRVAAELRFCRELGLME